MKMVVLWNLKSFSGGVERMDQGGRFDIKFPSSKPENVVRRSSQRDVGPNQPGAGPNIYVRWVCWRETLCGVSKLALREGASVTLDPILPCDGFSVPQPFQAVPQRRLESLCF